MAAVLSACSLLAPGDDEYLGGSNTAGASGAGTGGGGTGGGSVGGTSAGGTSAGGTAGAAGTPSGGGSGAVGGAGGATGGAGGASGGAGGTGATGAAGGAGGTAATGGTGGTGATGGSGGTGGSTCVPGQADGKPQTVALYAMIDRTQSVVTGPWAMVESGIGSYVDSAQSAGTALGLHYWPSGGSCSGTGYDTPAVPFALLPGNASAIKASLASAPAAGIANPMDGVVLGGIAACKAYMNANAKRQCKLVLVSDYGTTSTNTCTGSMGVLTNLLSNARQSLPSVITHVIRLPTANGSPLDQLAQAGSQNGANNVTSSTDVASAFRQFQRPCQYDLPGNAAGGTVTWQLGSTQLSQVSGPAACNTGQQYYLTPDAMVLCPETCAVGTNLTPPAVTSTVTCI